MNIDFFKKLPDGFWEKVEVRGTNDCWEWKAGKGSDGYGIYFINRKPFRAHRLVVDAPPGTQVCHTCDNKVCMNPKHLVIADHAWNMQDKKNKGRQASLPGEENPNSKLTEADVINIRAIARYCDITAKRIAEIYGLEHSTITKVIRRSSWKHVA